MTRVRHVSTRDFVTSEPIELQTSVRGQNGVEFHQEFNGYGPRHVTYVYHVSYARFLFGMVQCSIFMTILYLLIPLSYRQVLEVKIL